MTYLRFILFPIILLLYSEMGVAQILFSRSKGPINSGGTLDLMIYNVETGTTRLLQKGTVRKRGEYNAVVSPNGEYIVFNTYQFGGWKLGIGRLDDGAVRNVRKLTGRRNYEYEASFSWDGTQLAYLDFDWGSRKISIFLADGDGKNATSFLESHYDVWTPQWAPDNSALIYSSNSSGNYSIFRKAIEGGDVKQLTDDKANDFAPSTCKGCDKIAYLSDDGGRISLFIMNLDGRNKTNLTQGFNSDKFKLNGYESSGCWTMKTSWSPDGKRIVFPLFYEGDLELFIINSDGTGLKQITKNSDTDMTPFWME